MSSFFEQADANKKRLALFTRLIQLEEGRKLVAYKDSLGHWTIGDGYNLEAHGYSPDECHGMTWTSEQADAATSDEIQSVLAELDRRWPKWRDLDEVRQAAIVSSVYQLGAPGASKFFATIHAIQEHDFETAANQMLASLWAKQTPARVKRNADMIRTGQWPEEVNDVKFLPETTPGPELAPTQPEPRTSVLPNGGLPNTGGHGETLGQTMGTVDIQTTRALTSQLAKLIGKSPVTYGASGLFTMLVGNVRIRLDLWVFDQHYLFQDANILAALVAVGVVAWGLIGKHVKDLRQASAVILTFLLFTSLTLSACVPSSSLPVSGTGQSSASLGPDRIEDAESATTLPQRIKSGVAWLWASYKRLEASGALPGLDDLRNDIVDLEAVARRGDLGAALNIYMRARNRVTKIMEAASK